MSINLKHGKYIIYGLEDPESKEIRYIGKSTSGLRRPKVHLMPSSYNNPNKRHFHIYCWIRSLLKIGLKPNIVVLESCLREELSSKEIQYIQNYRAEGIGITNLVEGGDGMLGLKHSEATKNKISQKNLGRVRSKTEREKQSASISGKNHWNYGKKASKETKLKLSSSHKGIIPSKEALIKRSLSMIGKNTGPKSKEHVEKLRLAKKDKMKPIVCVTTGEVFESISFASRKLDIPKERIQNSIRKGHLTRGLKFELYNKALNDGLGHSKIKDLI